MEHELENIDLTVAQRKEIAALLKRHLPDTEVWAYGSRVKFTSKPSSDLDMVAFASSSQKVAVYDLKEAFEESDLPFRVDLFIWDEVPEQFHKNIEAERVVLQKVVEKRVVGSEWKSVPIGKCATVYSGFAFKSQDLGNEGVPVVKIKNVNNKVVDFSETQFFPQNLVTPRHDKFFLEDGDVLIAMTGQGSVGRVGRIRLGNNQKVLLNQRVGRFIVKSNLNIGYLYYVISSDYYEDILFNAGLGSGQPNLSPAVIAQIEIPLPPLLEQKAIAHILGSLDDKIELNRRMNATLEGMAQALFKSWFVDFDPVLDNAIAAGNPIPEELVERAEVRRQALANGTA
ncbi:MAG: restriction endonuclease subunit S, partial [SAR324 cluster bacterium]|nr:restriction endonuclease subunit S [SAR324 cluster bacterium]